MALTWGTYSHQCMQSAHICNRPSKRRCWRSNNSRHSQVVSRIFANGYNSWLRHLVWNWIRKLSPIHLSCLPKTSEAYCCSFALPYCRYPFSVMRLAGRRQPVCPRSINRLPLARLNQTAPNRVSHRVEMLRGSSPFGPEGHRE